MAKHVLSMTYAPKINAVQDGRCTQTIRRRGTIKAGDSIMFHGWSGKAYRSKWNDKMRVTVTEVIHCLASTEGLKFENTKTIPWDDIIIDIIAQRDFIDPPTGLALRGVLFELNGGAPSTPVECQIIRWEIDRKATVELRKEASGCTN